MTCTRIVLALDLGRRVGWAVDKDALGVPLTGTEILPGRFPDYGVSYRHFQDWLIDMIAEHHVDVLVWEAPIPFGGKRGSTRPTNLPAIEFANALAGCAETAGTAAGVTCWKVYAGTARKHFTGSGKATKEDVHIRCKQLGWRVESSDAADACAIWDFCRHQYKLEGLVAGPLFAQWPGARLRRPASLKGM